MRLIDIDKVVSDYKGKNKSLKNVTWFELTDYEVKAIPVEWIEKFMNRFRLGMVTSDEYALLHFMLTEWENENEID